MIINTHSPAVVQQVPDDSLLFAELWDVKRGEERFKKAQFAYLPDTWRANAPEGARIIQRGELLAYLNPVPDIEVPSETERVIDRADLRPLLPGFRNAE